MLRRDRARGRAVPDRRLRVRHAHRASLLTHSSRRRGGPLHPRPRVERPSTAGMTAGRRVVQRRIAGRPEARVWRGPVSELSDRVVPADEFGEGVGVVPPTPVCGLATAPTPLDATPRASASRLRRCRGEWPGSGPPTRGTIWERTARPRRWLTPSDRWPAFGHAAEGRPGVPAPRPSWQGRLPRHHAPVREGLDRLIGTRVPVAHRLQRPNRAPVSAWSVTGEVSTLHIELVSQASLLEGRRRHCDGREVAGAGCVVGGHPEVVSRAVGEPEAMTRRAVDTPSRTVRHGPFRLVARWTT
jgi:hypothetical protein